MRLHAPSALFKLRGVLWHVTEVDPAYVLEGRALCRQGNAALTPGLCELDESTGALVALIRSGRHI